MEEKLLKLSFITAIIGILALFFISEYLDYEHIDIGRIYDIPEDDKIKLIGVVDGLHSNENITFISVSEPQTVNVIAFDNVSIDVGDKVEIIGTVSDDDVIALRIRVIG